jgi:hypothetical protein
MGRCTFLFGEEAMPINVDNYLTPESMVTPGVAGSMAMMIGNTLHYQFNLPNGWSILVLSFVFGLLVWARSKSLLTSAVLYVINSLVIFCMAAGAISLSADSGNGQGAEALSLVRSTYAQQTTAELHAEYKQLSAQYDALWAQIKAAPAGANVKNLLQNVEDIDRKRAAVLRSINANTTSKSMSSGAGGSSEKKFFAPLKF